MFWSIIFASIYINTPAWGHGFYFGRKHLFSIPTFSIKWSIQCWESIFCGQQFRKLLPLEAFVDFSFIQKKKKQVFCQKWTEKFSQQTPLAAPLRPLHAPPHQTGEDGHHHFGVDLHQILGQSVNFSSNLPRHGDGIPAFSKSHAFFTRRIRRYKNIKLMGLLLCIVQFVFVRQSVSFYQLKVDAMRLDGIDEVQNRETAADGFILAENGNVKLKLHIYSSIITIHLKAFDGWSFAGFRQSLVDPRNDQIISSNFSVSQVFQHI